MRLPRSPGYAAVPLLCWALAAPVQAVDGLAVEVGRSFGASGAATNQVQAAVQWDLKQTWKLTRDWQLGGYLDLSAGYWWTFDRLANHDLFDFGITPVARLERTRPLSGVIPYVELGIGVHYLTDRQITDTRYFGSNFQFGDHLGVGLRFGERGQYDLSLRVQHISNAGIRQPNPGINFGFLRFQYRFF